MCSGACRKSTHQPALVLLEGLAGTLHLTAVSLTKPADSVRPLQCSPVQSIACGNATQRQCLATKGALVQILLSRNSEHYSDTSTTSTVGRLPGTGAWQWASPNPLITTALCEAARSYC